MRIGLISASRAEPHRYEKVTNNEVLRVRTSQVYVNWLQLKTQYMRDVVDKAHPFQADTRKRLEEGFDQLIELYTKCVTGGDAKRSSRELRIHQIEHVVWERSTVWQRMISGARRGGGTDSHPRVVSDASTVVEPIAQLGGLKITRALVGQVVALLALILLNIFPAAKGAEASRCLAILVFATILWATEVRTQE